MKSKVGANNIIQFPKAHLRPEILSKEGKARNKKGKQVYADEMTTRCMTHICEGFEAFGVDVASESFERDLAYIYETTQAIMYRQLKLKHPMHLILNKGKKITENGSDFWVFPEAVPSKKVATNEIIQEKPMLPFSETVLLAGSQTANSANGLPSC